MKLISSILATGLAPFGEAHPRSPWKRADSALSLQAQGGQNVSQLNEPLILTGFLGSELPLGDL